MFMFDIVDTNATADGKLTPKFDHKKDLGQMTNEEILAEHTFLANENLCFSLDLIARREELEKNILEAMNSVYSAV
jgi:hypothetical protein